MHGGAGGGIRTRVVLNRFEDGCPASRPRQHFHPYHTSETFAAKAIFSNYAHDDAVYLGQSLTSGRPKMPYDIEPPKRSSKYPKLGEAECNDGACCVIVSEYLTTLDPSKYFITTGEALEKMDKMLNDATEFIVQAKKLRKLLLKARSDSQYLETGWEDGVLILKQKNLRKPKVRP